MDHVTLESGVSICYDTLGTPADRPIVLVHGYTMQLTAWDEGFCQRLVDAGRYVIRLDLRDSGLSTTFDDAHPNPLEVLEAGLSGAPLPEVPYTLSDMAADVFGLLDALSISQADVVGLSMGGMICQTLAIEHPDRIASMVSIMSSVGDVDYGRATDEAIAVLTQPAATNRDEAIARSVTAKVWASPEFFDPERQKRRAAAYYDRATHPTAGARQLSAIYASGDRSEGLRQLTVPTLVIHGDQDTLIDISGGRRTAELVPGAHLLEIAGMGHDMPEVFWPLLTSAILGHSETAALAAQVRSARTTVGVSV